MDQLRVPPEMFRFTHGDRAGLYVSMLHAFGEANERLETALGIDDVRGRLRSVGWLDALDDDDLAAALGQLREWNLVDVIQNHSEDYRSASEYERRNLQYSLTRQGEAAFAGVQHAMSVLAATSALQTAVLDAIGDRLGDLVHELETGSDRRIFTTLTELEGHLEALRANTKQFNGELQRLLRADGADLATFHEVKASTVTYLQEFLTNLDHRTHAIAARIGQVEEHGVGLMHMRALLGADLPLLAGADPGPAWLEHRRARWEGLRAWFRPAGDAPPRVEQLHLVARRAIITLLQVLDRITESRNRTSSAAADFRELARWFTQAPGQDDLHRLRSGSARPGTLISAIPTRTWSARRPRGARHRRWRSRRCSARPGGPSASAGPAGSVTSRRSRPHGRSGPGPSALNSRRPGTCWAPTAGSGCPASAVSITRCSSACWSCWARPWPAARTGRARGGAAPPTGGSRSS
jgi:uncharacterized protein (TIGR02677 family)